MRAGGRTAALLGALALVASVLAAAPAGAEVGAPAGGAFVVTQHYAPSMSLGLDVSCPTRRDCYQVALTSSGLAAVRATTDGGATWRTVLTGGPGVALDTISCSARLSCLVVDGEDTLVGYWTGDGGATWQQRRLPPGIQLVSDASCVRSGACGLVGLDDGDDPVLLVTEDRGRSWREHAIDPATTPDALVNTTLVVSCVTWELCLVGRRIGGRVLYRTTDAGRRWTTPSLGASATMELTSISCTRVGHCAATLGTGDEGVVETSGDAGATWRRTVDSSSVIGFFSASCTDRGACVATTATSLDRLVVFRSADGVHWRETAVGGPPLGGAPYVSCGGSSCTLVAALQTGLELTESSDDLGATWQDVDPEQPATEPLAASCPVAGTCEIVGADASGALAERTTDDGATFTRQSLPNGIAGVTKVSCATSLDCQAIGVSALSDGEVLLGTSDGGTTWSAEDTPLTLGAITSVVCASATACVATALDQDFNLVMLVTDDGGTTWTTATLDGYKEQLAEPESATCSSAEDCIVGLFSLPTPGYLTTTDAGSTWSFEASPADLGGGLGPIPIDAACTTATQCVSITESIFGGGGLSVLVSSDAGATWTAVNALGAAIDQVSPLACLSDGTCEVIGAEELASRSYLLTTPDSGATWSSTPMPPGWLASIALSCPTDTSCFTVGILGDGGLGFARMS